MGEHDDSAAAGPTMAEWLREAAKPPGWAWEQFDQQVRWLLVRHALAQPDVQARVAVAAERFEFDYVMDARSGGFADLKPRDLSALLPEGLPDLKRAPHVDSLLRLQADYAAARQRARARRRALRGSRRLAVLGELFPDVSPRFFTAECITPQAAALAVVAARYHLSPGTVRRLVYLRLSDPALLDHERRARPDGPVLQALRDAQREVAGEKG